MLSFKFHGWLHISMALGLAVLIAAGCGDDDDGGSTVTTDRCAAVMCVAGSTCDPVTGFCTTSSTSNSTSNGTTSTSNGTTSASCPDDCAQPDSTCDGSTAVTYSGAGACMDDGSCDFSGVEAREDCPFYCDGGQCTAGELGAPCAGLPSACKPGSFCDPSTDICAAGCDEDDDCTNEGETCDTDTNMCVVSCAPDDFEPNETADDAAELEPTVDQVYRESDLVLCPSDVDWFSVVLEEGQAMQLQANQINAEGGLKITLFAPDGTEFGSAASTQEISLEGALAGEYTMSVVPDDENQVEYNLIILLQDEPSLCSNDLQEPNNEAREASDLELVYGQTRTLGMLTLCDEDADYYLFDAEAGDEVSISFDPIPEGGINVRVVNDDTGVSLYNDVVTNSDELSFDGLEEGEHLIVVTPLDPVAEEGEQYGLRTTLFEGEAAACVDDGLEDNDSGATAAPLGAPGNDALTWCDGDGADWYSVFAPSNADVDLSLVYEDSAQGTLAMIVYRDAPEDANVVAIGTAGTCEGRDCITVDTLTATGGDTTFYIFIQATAINNPDNALNYSLDVDVSGCPPDNNEPNNSAALDVATDLETDCRTRANICPSDEDWFRIVTDTPDEVFVLSAHFFHAQGDVDLTLYVDEDNSGTIEPAERIDRSWNPADCESVTNEGNAGVQEYWLKVDGAEASIEQDVYRIVWGASCEMDEPQVRFCE